MDHSIQCFLSLFTSTWYSRTKQLWKPFRLSDISIEVWRNYELVQKFEKPSDMINGYEYQFAEAAECIAEGRLESKSMPMDDTVKVMETRPLSKDKRWRVVEIITKAK